MALALPQQREGFPLLLMCPPLMIHGCSHPPAHTRAPVCRRSLQLALLGLPAAGLRDLCHVDLSNRWPKPQRQRLIQCNGATLTHRADIARPMTCGVSHSAKPAATAARDLDPLLARPVLTDPHPPPLQQRSGDAVALGVLTLAVGAAHPKRHMPRPECPHAWIVAALQSHRVLSLRITPQRSAYSPCQTSVRSGHAYAIASSQLDLCITVIVDNVPLKELAGSFS